MPLLPRVTLGRPCESRLLPSLASVAAELDVLDLSTAGPRHASNTCRLVCQHFAGVRRANQGLDGHFFDLIPHAIIILNDVPLGLEKAFKFIVNYLDP